MMERRSENRTGRGLSSRQLSGLGMSPFVAVFCLLGIFHADRSLAQSPPIDPNRQAGTRCETVAFDTAPPGTTSDTERAEIQRCSEELQRKVLVYASDGRLLSTAVCCPWLSVVVTIALLPDPNGKADLVVVTSGFEPLDDEEDYSIEIFQADSGRRIAMIWSESPPKFLHPDGDRETVEIVFTRDIFGVRRPGAPGWPVIAAVRRGLVIVPLKESVHVLRSSHAEARRVLEEWKEICKAFEPDPCPLTFIRAAKRLEAQVAALEILMGVSPVP